MPIPNWGPSKGKNVPDGDAYVKDNPPPPGGLFTLDAVQPEGASAATLGPVAEGKGVAEAILGNVARTAQNPSLGKWGTQKSVDFHTPLDASAANAMGQQQALVIQALQAQAAGDPNSQAQQQLLQGYGNAQAQQASLGSTMRGQSHGAALRGVQQGQQGIQRGLAGDQQMLMLQERQAAQAQLAQQLAQQQQGDLTQAKIASEGNLREAAMNQGMSQFYAGNNIALAIALSKLKGEGEQAAYGFGLDRSDTNNRLVGNLLNAGAAAAGTAAQYGSPPPSSSQQKIDKAFDGED